MDNKHVNKVLHFATALQDCYKDEDNRESCMLSKMELSNEELTDDFIAMLEAQKFLYEKITGDEQDLLGFTHILNRLAVQDAMKSLEEDNG